MGVAGKVVEALQHPDEILPLVRIHASDSKRKPIAPPGA